MYACTHITNYSFTNTHMKTLCLTDFKGSNKELIRACIIVASSMSVTAGYFMKAYAQVEPESTRASLSLKEVL